MMLAGTRTAARRVFARTWPGRRFRDEAGRMGAMLLGRGRKSRQKLRGPGSLTYQLRPEVLAERRRSRTDRAVGYTTARVLKTRWATGPMPLRRAR